MPSIATLPTAVLRGKAIIATVHKYALQKARADKLYDDNALLKVDILKAMGDLAVASCGSHVVRVTDVAGIPAKPNIEITKEMIGVVIIGSKGRAGSTKLEVI